MKKNKIIYWLVTGIFSLLMLFSAYTYLTSVDAEKAFEHLGFPNYFRVELAIAKIAGAIVLLLPFLSKGFKQIAYFGFALTLISAIIAHNSSGDALSVIIVPFIFVIVLAVSYIYYYKLQRQ